MLNKITNASEAVFTTAGKQTRGFGAQSRDLCAKSRLTLPPVQSEALWKDERGGRERESWVRVRRQTVQDNEVYWMVSTINQNQTFNWSLVNSFDGCKQIITTMIKYMREFPPDVKAFLVSSSAVWTEMIWPWLLGCLRTNPVCTVHVINDDNTTKLSSETS